MRLARLDAWLSIALTYLEKKEKLGGHRQKLYVDTLKKFVSKAVNSISACVSQLVYFREQENWKSYLKLLCRTWKS